MRVAPGTLEAAEFFVDCLVPLTDRRTFGLGGMRGENGINTHFPERGNSVGLAKTFLFETVDDGWPESFDGGGSVFGPTRAAELPGYALFDDIEQFKADREELGAFALVTGGDCIGDAFSILPRNEGAEFVVEWKGLGEESGGFGEGILEFTESFLKILVVFDGVGHPQDDDLEIETSQELV